MQSFWLFILLFLPLSISSSIKDNGQFDELPAVLKYTYPNQLQSELEYYRELGLGYCFSPKRKSPINIDIGNVTLAPFRPLVFTDYSVSENVSESIQSNFTAVIHGYANWTAKPVLSGGPLSDDYNLVEIQWDMTDLKLERSMYGVYYGHSVNEVEHDFELHFVHTKGGLSIEKARQIPDGIVIVAVFINQRNPWNRYHELFASHNIPEETGEEFKWLSPDTFLPKNRDAYFTYTGTFIHPPCSGDVMWIILANPIFMSNMSMQSFLGSSRPNHTSMYVFNIPQRTNPEVSFHMRQVLSVSGSSNTSIIIYMGVGFIFGMALGVVSYYMRMKFSKKTIGEEGYAVNYQNGFDNMNDS